MLNSRYAPIVAITALLALAILVAGWFLAISPQLERAADYAADEQRVDTNIATIEQAAEQLALAQADVANFADLDAVIQTNAPSRFDLSGVRDRIWTAVTSSGVELVSVASERGTPIAGWPIDSTVLPSTTLVSYFSDGPAATTTVPAPEFTPVVTPPAPRQVLAENLVMVSYTFEVVGTPREVHTLLGLLQNPELQLFQVYSLDFEAQPENAIVSEGIYPTSAGDVVVNIAAATYVADADTTTIDDGELENVGVGSRSPWLEPEEPASPQPGADS